ncbi:DUF6441 family protein [Hoeflea sp.]|uniref:DUF6441 family protein n=1 Tax=Hoeflea sp. TaxID=1940281 RepID=UPI0019A3DB45|nr:DUF6441 family protein [Hoeflea sp.]MBC7282671.1 hypothetical protein [Hoeflea sp.]
MRFKLAVKGDLVRSMKAEEERIARAVSAGGDSVLSWVQDEYRGQIEPLLGRRVAKTVRKKRYPSAGNSIGWAGLVYSRADKIVANWQSGATIRSKDGFFLAIPTAAAPKKGAGGKRISPSNFPEHSLGPLRFVYRKGKPALLVVDEQRARKGKRGGFSRASARARKTGTGLVSVPMFVLVPLARIPKKLSLERVRVKAAQRLPREIRHNLETLPLEI